MNLKGLIPRNSWVEHLREEFEKPYFHKLEAFLLAETREGSVLFPPARNIFRALELTPLEKVRVVLLGQDPYHGFGQAHGLAFSVPDGTPFPPSLKNIFKELHSDLGVALPGSGDLTLWAKNGILLLNTTMTVREGEAGSHSERGWAQFTDRILSIINDENQNVAFVLWGAQAQEKARLIDSRRHLVLKAPHPSPLSSYRGFFGSRPFSQINQYFLSEGRDPLNWSLSKETL